MDVGKQGRRNQGLAGMAGLQQGAENVWTIPMREMNFEDKRGSRRKPGLLQTLCSD